MKRQHLSSDQVRERKLQRQRDRRAGIRRRDNATKIGGKYRVESDLIRLDAEERIAERDRLAALDNRTPAQVWLNDPPHWRSALAQRGTR